MEGRTEGSVLVSPRSPRPSKRCTNSGLAGQHIIATQLTNSKGENTTEINVPAVPDEQEAKGNASLISSTVNVVRTVLSGADNGSESDWLTDRRVWITLYLILFILPIARLKKMDSLRFTSSFALLCFGCIVVIIALYAVNPNLKLRLYFCVLRNLERNPHIVPPALAETTTQAAWANSTCGPAVV